ncbi:MAG TPA: PLP-dependent transferase [Jatrophihabitans sp.]|jgi:cystathionine gamma-synthase|uniref:trans-sulfuration enzyme family protein n=1 Tax=Jatrophihabitans sp. TaxID=1932789 RepID=UPI002EF058FB
MHPEPLRRESLLVAAGRPPRIPAGPVNQPISLTSTFHAGGQRVYGRDGNDSVEAFETALGAVEGGQVTAFSSGMAACAALIEGLPVGSVVVLPTTFYNFNRILLDKQVELGRLTLRTVDVTDTDAALDALPGATLLWLEVPTNPMLVVPDLPALAEAARQHGVLSVVDATLATPLGIRPLEHGADVVMHSATKWIAGHSDLVMGTLATADGALDEQLKARRTLTGALPGALESFLALRGLRTLSVRLERACATAAELAQRLSRHPSVRVVRYLGLPDHPHADRIAKLMDNHGGLLSFEPDSLERAEQVCARIQLITHATSLGGVESLLERRGSYPGESRQQTPPELIRLSVGLEHVEDLWDDLEQALA